MTSTWFATRPTGSSTPPPTTPPAPSAAAPASWTWARFPGPATRRLERGNQIVAAAAIGRRGGRSSGWGRLERLPARRRRLPAAGLHSQRRRIRPAPGHGAGRRDHPGGTEREQRFCHPDLRFGRQSRFDVRLTGPGRSAPAALAIQPERPDRGRGSWYRGRMGHWRIQRDGRSTPFSATPTDDGRFTRGSAESAAARNAAAMAIDGLGNILVAGVEYAAPTDAVLARYTSGGLGVQVTGSAPALATTSIPRRAASTSAKRSIWGP